MPFLRPEDFDSAYVAVPLLDLLHGLIPIAPVTAAIITSGTIATWDTTRNLPITCVRLTNAAGAATAVVLAAGKFDGQPVELINTGANTVTFDTAATSNVADGASDAIGTLTSQVYRWDSTSARWMHRT